TRSTAASTLLTGGRSSMPCNLADGYGPAPVACPAATGCVGDAVDEGFGRPAGEPDAAGGAGVTVGEAGGDAGGVDAGTEPLGDADFDEGGAEDDGGADDGGGAPICAAGGNCTTLVCASAAFMKAAHIWAGSVPP